MKPRTSNVTDNSVAARGKGIFVEKKLNAKSGERSLNAKKVFESAERSLRAQSGYSGFFRCEPVEDAIGDVDHFLIDSFVLCYGVGKWNRDDAIAS